MDLIAKTGGTFGFHRFFVRPQPAPSMDGNAALRMLPGPELKKGLAPFGVLRILFFSSVVRYVNGSNHAFRPECLIIS